MYHVICRRHVPRLFTRLVKMAKATVACFKRDSQTEAAQEKLSNYQLDRPVSQEVAATVVFECAA